MNYITYMTVWDVACKSLIILHQLALAFNGVGHFCYKLLPQLNFYIIHII